MTNGVIIRPEREADFAAVLRVHREAFGDEDVLRLVERLEPLVALVAEIDGAVVGHIALSRASIEPGARPVLCLSPLGVHPQHQRRGVGSALTLASLAEARQLGEELVVVEGVPAYYPRFGFVRARSLGIEPPSPVPDEAWMALALTDEPRDWRGRAALSHAFDHLAPH